MNRYLCPVHAEPLLWHFADYYTCTACHTTWLIAPDTSHAYTFNRRAPFAQLVIDADRILSENIRTPETSTA